MTFREENYENAVLEHLENKLAYTRLYGPDITRDYHNPLYEKALQAQLPAINPKLSQAAIDEAVHKLRHLDDGSLEQRNMIFTDWLQNGMDVCFAERGEQKYAHVRLVDYENPSANTFHAINQWTIVERETKRPDIVLFVNGLPLVVLELKSCSRAETDVSEAYRQIKNYMKEIPTLFVYNAFCIISDMIVSKAGTITSGEGRFMEWKTVDGSREEKQFARFDVLLEGMLQKERLLDLVRNFLLFSKSMDGNVKILSAYHQYFAVRKAVDSTCEATQADGKGGVFWHTQGSGKSLSMVFYAKQLQEKLDSPTIVVITDRNDLDDQLYGQFASCKDFLRQTPQQAESRTHLRELLAGRQANGIFFTTMQKFEETDEALSDRRNIIVIADEAHRSQYGLEERVTRDGRVVVGAARVIRDSLPRATFIGFTGTPISFKDRNTREIFGDYVDIYDMTQAVEDGATRPVYYESRVINLGLNEDVLRQIDTTYDLLSLNADEHVIEKSKKELARMESILGAPQTIDSLCRDIVEHYEQGRQNLLAGKALIVAYSRAIAIDIYKKILELRPHWTEKVKAVMTASNDDPEEWRDIIGNKGYRKELAKHFKDDNHPLKIAIVVDMWLTGFDVPSLATMYVYKPMKDYGLMQAIARVNRVYKDKEGGLVVDYVGIAKALKEAMNDYTDRDRKNYGEMNIAQTALPKFVEKLQVCKELFGHFDLTPFVDGRDTDRARAIIEGINLIIGDEEKKAKFLKEGFLLKQAQTLCSSLLDRTQRMEAAFFDAVRVAVGKVTTGKKLSLREINDQINQLLKQSIRSDGVINLFSDAKEKFSIFDPGFLEEIANMAQKNLAAELLRKLIAEQVSIYKRTNLVQSERFSERMAQVMNAYRNGQITNAEVIDELRKIGEDIARAHEEGKALGLTTEELAFYDAISKPEAIKDFYTHDQLRDMTKELTDLLRKNRTIDWYKKESARAEMRSLVKRLLRKYKYPPEGMDDAVQTVIAQCEMWTDSTEKDL